MTNLETAYKWALSHTLNLLTGMDNISEEDIELTVESVMRDWDMKNPDTLTDTQWEDICYCIRDQLSDMVECDS